MSAEQPMFEVKVPWYQGAQEMAFRLAVSKILPIRFFYPDPPENLAARTGRLHIEIVSHCWRYSHLQAYQLSSLVLHPPQNVDVTMTVFYAQEDEATRQLLDFFSQHEAPDITWNWQRLPAPELFRRAIGRNKAALATQADWIWFTDCDLVFGEGALDALAQQVQGCSEPLVYPREERVTPLLTNDSPVLKAAREPRLVSVNVDDFTTKRATRATGPLQITHGDIARKMGYCNDLAVYQRATDRWRKTYEDRTFRWLLKTQGTPIDVPAVYRIRHEEKGRYTGSQSETAVRTSLRKAQEKLKS